MVSLAAWGPGSLLLFYLSGTRFGPFGRGVWLLPLFGVPGLLTESEFNHAGGSHEAPCDLCRGRVRRGVDIGAVFGRRRKHRGRARRAEIAHARRVEGT